ncbi:MAG: amino acid ABC transporter substrate-binding protein [Candidatus Electrothrix sp. AUS4]|nr:amino acid ABC transporter substrate-binding protein [Candidatus Electrothrix sp. AUS4]
MLRRYRDNKLLIVVRGIGRFEIRNSLLAFFLTVILAGHAIAEDSACLSNRCKEGGQEEAKEIILSPDMQRILDKGKLVVAMHCDDGAPFWTLNKECKLVGLDVDLATDIAANLGVDLEFNRDALTFDGVVDKVASREADLGISCISQTRQRAVKVNFTEPYVKLYYAFIINRVKTARLSAGKEFNQWINDSRVTLGTVAGSSYVEFIQRDYPKSSIKLYPDWEACCAAVLSGEVHAVLFDDSMVRGWINDHPEDVLYLQTKMLQDKEDPISIVVHWQDTHLLNWLNLYLATLKRDGTLDAWIEKWLKKHGSSGE